MQQGVITKSPPIAPPKAKRPRARKAAPVSPVRRAVVELEGVRKTFGQQTAVDDLSLRVPEKSICGFIGPNGSGKTTTLRLILGIYRPDAGSIRVFGGEKLTAASERIGYLPEERGLYKRMRVVDLLRFYAELKGCRNVKQDVDEWLDRLSLKDAASKRIDALSKGMAQKVQFIATVINRPKLIILDEPFSGLDPVNTDVIREAVLDLRREGATIIFSTHDMAVAEKMCDFIVMMFQGEKVLDGTIDAIQDDYGQDTIRVRIDPGETRLDDLPGVKRVTNLGQYQELWMHRDYDAQNVLDRLRRLCDILHFEVTAPSLHDIFVRIARPESAEVSRA